MSGSGLCCTPVPRCQSALYAPSEYDCHVAPPVAIVEGNSFRGGARTLAAPTPRSEYLLRSIIAVGAECVFLAISNKPTALLSRTHQLLCGCGVMLSFAESAKYKSKLSLSAKRAHLGRSKCVLGRLLVG